MENLAANGTFVGQLDATILFLLTAFFVAFTLLGALLSYSLIGKKIERTVDNHDKDIKREFDDIEQFLKIHTDPRQQVLVDRDRLDAYKETFQSIYQGQAPLWTPPKE